MKSLVKLLLLLVCVSIQCDVLMAQIDELIEDDYYSLDEPTNSSEKVITGDEVISLEACETCCEKVRDLNFFVSPQHSGRCKQEGCSDQSCGGFACRTGLNFRQGLDPEFQTDGNGEYVAYTCAADGSITLYADQGLTPFPTSSPTPFPSTSAPTPFPVVEPTPFPTETPPTLAPTASPPTPFPTTSPPTTTLPTPSPTETAPTPFPTTQSPTQAPVTGAPTATARPTAAPSDETVIISPRGISVPAIIGIATVLGMLCVGCLLFSLFAITTKERERDMEKHKEKKRKERERKNRAKGKGIEPELNPELYDDEGRLLPGADLGAKLRNAVWTKHENVFGDEVKKTVDRKDYKGQTRKSMGIPPPPMYIPDEDTPDNGNRHSRYLKEYSVPVANPRKSFQELRLSQQHASFKLGEDFSTVELQEELFRYQEEEEEKLRLKALEDQKKSDAAEIKSKRKSTGVSTTLSTNLAEDSTVAGDGGITDAED